MNKDENKPVGEGAYPREEGNTEAQPAPENTEDTDTEAQPEKAE